MKSACAQVLTLALLLSTARPGNSAEPQNSDEVERASTAAATVEPGQSMEPFRRLEDAVRQSIGSPASRQQVEAGLLKLLAPEASYQAKKFACQQLGIIGSQAGLQPLAKLLETRDTVGIACVALATYPPGKADEALRNALAWGQGDARVQIINTLGDRRDPKAVAPLSKQAIDADPAVAEAAIAALGKIGTPAAWKALADRRAKSSTLGGALADATLRAAEALAASGNVRKAKGLYEDLLENAEPLALRRSALAALLALDSAGGEERILETLSGTNALLKPVAIAAISRMPSHVPSGRLAAELHHLRPEEQALLVGILAERGDDEARLALAKALSSPEPLTRRAAIAALGRLGDPYFTSLLARAATLASDPEENRAIESALFALKGGEETDNKLLAELKTSMPKSRILLIGALSRRQGSAANPVLLEETENTDPAVGKAAFRALGRSGTGAEVSQLLTKVVGAHDAGVRTEGESAATQVLRRIEDPSKRSTPVLQALAKAKTAEGKASCIRLLPVCGDEAALTALKAVTADPDNPARDVAVRTLAEWPDPSARDALLRLYRLPEEGTVHELALRGLVRLTIEEHAVPEARVSEHYRELIAGARDASELKLILGGLSGYGRPEALALALPLLSNVDVRPEAIVAVKKIAESIKAENPQLAEEALKRLPNP